jgi:putative membrane protein
MNRSMGIILFAAAASIAAPALAKPAPEFLGAAAKGDRSEVMLGRLAADRGASPGIRDFGKRLVADHGGHLTKVEALARHMHVMLPPGEKPEARALYARLQHMRGPAFDRAFDMHMIADHREDIGDYEAQARTGDRETSAFARDTLPTLREHLRIAQSLRR